MTIRFSFISLIAACSFGFFASAINAETREFIGLDKEAVATSHKADDVALNELDLAEDASSNFYSSSYCHFYPYMPGCSYNYYDDYYPYSGGGYPYWGSGGYYGGKWWGKSKWRGRRGKFHHRGSKRGFGKGRSFRKGGFKGRKGGSKSFRRGGRRGRR